MKQHRDSVFCNARRVLFNALRLIPLNFRTNIFLLKKTRFQLALIAMAPFSIVRHMTED